MITAGYTGSVDTTAIYTNIANEMNISINAMGIAGITLLNLNFHLLLQLMNVPKNTALIIST